MLQGDSCERVIFINKPKLKKRQTRYTHRRKYAEKRLFYIIDEIKSRYSGDNYDKFAYHLTLIKGTKLKFNNELPEKYSNMPDDF